MDLNFYKTKLNELKTIANDVKVLAAAIDHDKGYNGQLTVLSALERARFNFKAAVSELEAYAYMREPKMKANRLKFHLNIWTKQINQF